MAIVWNPNTDRYEDDGQGPEAPAPPPPPPRQEFPENPNNPEGPITPGGPPLPPGTPGVPPPPGETPPAAADPWATAPADGNWQAWFLKNIQGTTPNSASLAALEAKLTPHGIKVLRNASGIAGKIQLPNGRIVDVGRGFSGQDPGYMAWVWQEGDGGEASGPTEPINPEYLAPFTETPPGRPEIPSFVGPGEFQSPTGESILQDPSFLFRRDQGRGVLENSAAARGTLNSGGTLRDIIDYGQKAASQEFGNVWDRAFANWNSNWGNQLNAYRTNADVTDSAYDDAYNSWLGRRETHYANQTNPFQKLYPASQYGG